MFTGRSISFFSPPWLKNSIYNPGRLWPSIKTCKVQLEIKQKYTVVLEIPDILKKEKHGCLRIGRPVHRNPDKKSFPFNMTYWWIFSILFAKDCLSTLKVKIYFIACINYGGHKLESILTNLWSKYFESICSTSILNWFWVYGVPISLKKYPSSLELTISV